MSQNTSGPARGTLAVRSGSSRRLLQRKAIEQATKAEPLADALEDSFPAEAGAITDTTTETADDAAARPDHAALGTPTTGAADLISSMAERGASSETTTPPTPQLSTAQAWSEDDESSFQGMLARRKAAGFQRRGKDVSAQLIRVGDIKPNDGTVIATIVALVAEHGPITRARLLDLMQAATFPHAKAKPEDRGWCQAYVAGAARQGFLTLATDPAASRETIELSVGEAAA